MSKDNVVIEESGMRFVFEKNPSMRGCSECKARHYCDSNITIRERLSCTGIICISATKITPQPRIYHAWDREEASRLLGKKVEYHMGSCGRGWERGRLVRIDGVEAPFMCEEEAAYMVREIPQIKMTWYEAKAKYGIEDNVVIVEGVWWAKTT